MPKRNAYPYRTWLNVRPILHVFSEEIRRKIRQNRIVFVQISTTSTKKFSNLAPFMQKPIVKYTKNGPLLGECAAPESIVLLPRKTENSEFVVRPRN